MILFFFEIIGTIAFAISGAFVAIEKKMDVFGVMILGMTTAVGGGIIRDLLLGIVPPTAFQKPVYALIAIAVAVLVFALKIKGVGNQAEGYVLLWMDSVGLAVFTVIGVRAGMTFQNVFLSLFVGVLTGVGGGVLRDLFAGNTPYIFVKHFYACASLAGAVVTVLLWRFGQLVAMSAGSVAVVLLRLLAAKFRWSLPKI